MSATKPKNVNQAMIDHVLAYICGSDDLENQVGHYIQEVSADSEFPITKQQFHEWIAYFNIASIA